MNVGRYAEMLKSGEMEKYVKGESKLDKERNKDDDGGGEVWSLIEGAIDGDSGDGEHKRSRKVRAEEASPRRNSPSLN